MLLPATDTSCIAEARRTARQVGRDAGFTDEGAERVDTVLQRARPAHWAGDVAAAGALEAISPTLSSP